MTKYDEKSTERKTHLHLGKYQSPFLALKEHREYN